MLIINSFVITNLLNAQIEEAKCQYKWFAVNHIKLKIGTSLPEYINDYILFSAIQISYICLL